MVCSPTLAKHKDALRAFLEVDPRGGIFTQEQIQEPIEFAVSEEKGLSEALDPVFAAPQHAAGSERSPRGTRSERHSQGQQRPRDQ